MMDAWSSLINVRQQPEEKLMDYIKRFKQIHDVLVAQVGEDILSQWITMTPWWKEEYEPSEKAELKEQAFEAWMGYLCCEALIKPNMDQLSQDTSRNSPWAWTSTHDPLSLRLTSYPSIQHLTKPTMKLARNANRSSMTYKLTATRLALLNEASPSPRRTMKILHAIAVARKGTAAMTVTRG
jgi:hypothetical protein